MKGDDPTVQRVLGAHDFQPLLADPTADDLGARLEALDGRHDVGVHGSFHGIPILYGPPADPGLAFQAGAKLGATLRSPRALASLA